MGIAADGHGRWSREYGRRLLRWVRCSLLAIVAAAPCAAQGGAPLDLQPRLDFLEQRLHDGRWAARTWQYSWGVANTAGIAYGLAGIARARSEGDIVAGAVNATKSVFGLVNLLLNPLPGTAGARPMRAASDPAARLAVGERLLAEARESSELRYRIAGYTKNLTVNLIGGGIILAAGNGEGALQSTFGGITLGVAQTWTEPERSEVDAAEYERRFDTSLSGAAGQAAAPMLRFGLAF